MKTPAEFEPIALWMGWEKYKRRVRPFCVEEFWRKPNGEDVGPVAFKTSLTDAECIEALNRLHEKELPASLTNAPCVAGGHKLDIWLGDYCVSSGYHPTINQAVEQAIAALIIAELGEGE